MLSLRLPIIVFDKRCGVEPAFAKASSGRPRGLGVGSDLVSNIFAS